MGIIDRVFGRGEKDTVQPDYHYQCQGCGEKYETSRVACDNCGAPVREIT